MILGTDCETTGLPHEDPDLLEVALVILEDDLSIRAQASWLMPCDPVASWTKATDYVRTMHTQNGLWQELYFASQGPQRTMAQVGDEIVNWCAHYNVYPCCGPMFGQGIAFDREILQMRLPSVRKMWNHRVIDVSGLKFMAKIWYGLQYTSKEEHRALADILETVECLRWLRREMFR